jgi:hypothetical protein
MTLKSITRCAFVCGWVSFLTILGTPAARASQYTYDVDFPLLVNATAGFETISGVIVTTCDNGCRLGPGNIVSWEFNIPGMSSLASDSGYAQPVQVNGTSPFVAGPSFITLNPVAGQPYGNIVFDDSYSAGDFFFIFRQFPADGASIQLFIYSQPDLFESFMGPLAIAYMPPSFTDCLQVDDCRIIPGLDRLVRYEERRILREDNPGLATPLPATLPVFATGLGALGLLGWRRKRKTKAAVS